MLKNVHEANPKTPFTLSTIIFTDGINLFFVIAETAVYYDVHNLQVSDPPDTCHF